MVAWSGAYGVRETVSGEPLRPDDVFQVASVSKSVAAYAVMRLVQEGRLDLDVPIARYLTRWRLPDSEHGAEGVTARRLLSHTAGLSTDSYPGLPPGVPLPALEESLGGVPGIELVHQVEAPGAVYRYSGGGYTVLQLAVEEVTGKTFADSLAESVLTPLGMSDSSYVQSPPRRQPRHMVPMATRCPGTASRSWRRLASPRPRPTWRASSQLASWTRTRSTGWPRIAYRTSWSQLRGPTAASPLASSSGGRRAPRTWDTPAPTQAGGPGSWLSRGGAPG